MNRIQLVTGWIIEALLKITRHKNSEVPKLFCLAGDHIGDRIFINSAYERDILDGLFTEIFASMNSRFAGGICIDAGANIGNHTMYFSSKFKKVISFEPNPILCLIIRANVELNNVNNVELFDCGLSDSDTFLDYIFDEDALGSSHFDDCDQGGRSMRLRVRKGDEVINTTDPTPISLIKIDVEGHEVSALTGLQSTIENHFPIILYESHPEKNAAEAEALQKLIKNFGYNYFYSYESPRNPYNWPLIKAGYRLWKGPKRRFKEFNGPLEAKEYLLLVASPEPIDFVSSR